MRKVIKISMEEIDEPIRGGFVEFMPWEKTFPPSINDSHSRMELSTYLAKIHQLSHMINKDNRYAKPHPFMSLVDDNYSFNSKLYQCEYCFQDRDAELFLETIVNANTERDQINLNEAREDCARKTKDYLNKLEQLESLTLWQRFKFLFKPSSLKEK